MPLGPVSPGGFVAEQRVHALVQHLREPAQERARRAFEPEALPPRVRPEAVVELRRERRERGDVGVADEARVAERPRRAKRRLDVPERLLGPPELRQPTRVRELVRLERRGRGARRAAGPARQGVPRESSETTAETDPPRPPVVRASSHDAARVLQEFRAPDGVRVGVERPREPPVVRADEAHARARVERLRRRARQDVRHVRFRRGAALAPERVAEGDQNLPRALGGVRRQRRDVLAPTRKHRENALDAAAAYAAGVVVVVGFYDGPGGPSSLRGMLKRRDSFFPKAAGDDVPRRRARQQELERAEGRPLAARRADEPRRRRRERRVARASREKHRVRVQPAVEGESERLVARSGQKQRLEPRQRRRRRSPGRRRPGIHPGARRRGVYPGVPEPAAEPAAEPALGPVADERVAERRRTARAPLRAALRPVRARAHRADDVAQERRVVRVLGRVRRAGEPGVVARVMARSREPARTRARRVRAEVRVPPPERRSRRPRRARVARETLREPRELRAAGVAPHGPSRFARPRADVPPPGVRPRGRVLEEVAEGKRRDEARGVVPAGVARRRARDPPAEPERERAVRRAAVRRPGRPRVAGRVARTRAGVRARERRRRRNRRRGEFRGDAGGRGVLGRGVLGAPTPLGGARVRGGRGREREPGRRRRLGGPIGPESENPRASLEEPPQGPPPAASCVVTTVAGDAPSYAPYAEYAGALAAAYAPYSFAAGAGAYSAYSFAAGAAAAFPAAFPFPYSDPYSAAAPPGSKLGAASASAEAFAAAFSSRSIAGAPGIMNVGGGGAAVGAAVGAAGDAAYGFRPAAESAPAAGAARGGTGTPPYPA